MFDSFCNREDSLTKICDHFLSIFLIFCSLWSTNHPSNSNRSNLSPSDNAQSILVRAIERLSFSLDGNCTVYIAVHHFKQSTIIRKIPLFWIGEDLNHSSIPLPFETSPLGSTLVSYQLIHRYSEKTWLTFSLCYDSTPDRFIGQI
jgi:hypothetical protein